MYKKYFLKTVLSLGACEVEQMLVEWVVLWDVEEIYQKSSTAVVSLGACEVEYMLVEQMDIWDVRK